MSSPNDTETLIAWLLGDLSPEEARLCEEAWRERPEEVARWRSFLDQTQRLGEDVRSYARVGRSHSPRDYKTLFKSTSIPKRKKELPHSSTPKSASNKVEAPQTTSRNPKPIARWRVFATILIPLLILFGLWALQAIWSA